MSAAEVPEDLWLRDNPIDPWYLHLLGAGLLFSMVGIPLIALMVGLGFVPEWWRHGERHTGLVIAVEDPGDDGNPEVTIRDPLTELDQVVHPDFWRPQVGDRGTAVVHPSDRSKVGTTAQVATYVALWALLPLATLGWAVFCGCCLIDEWESQRRHFTDHPRVKNRRQRQPRDGRRSAGIAASGEWSAVGHE